MRSPESTPAGPAPVWDIAVPSRPGRLPGVSMAGFRQRGGGPVDLQVVPYPAVTLVVDLADGLVVVDDADPDPDAGAGAGGHDDDDGNRWRGALVAGLAPGRVRGLGRDVECLQVRLAPTVAHRVLGDAATLGGTVTGLDDLWGRDATRRLRERLHTAPTWDDRFAIADAALARRHDDGRAVDPETAAAWGRLVATRGRVRVDRLAAEVGWSRQRLWSRFRSQIGLTPKRAARLVRFDHAAHRLAAGHDPARVAAEGGYVDQSHLHRDTVAFTGSTPTAVAAAPWLAVDDVAWPT